MYCSKCGKELREGSKFCNECGHKVELDKDGVGYLRDERQEDGCKINASEDTFIENTTEFEEEEPFSDGSESVQSENRIKFQHRIKSFFSVRRNVFILASSIVGLIIIVLSIVTYMNVDMYVKMVDAKQYSGANKMYNDIKDEKKFLLTKFTIDRVVSSKIENAYKKFIDEKIAYGDVKNILDFPSDSYPIKNKANEYSKLAEELNRSREMMQMAMKKENEKEYFDAIESYKNVSANDKKNYEISQKSIERCISELYQYYIDKSTNLSSSGSYNTSIDLLNKILVFYPDDANVKSKIEEHKKMYKESVIKRGDRLISENMFSEALVEVNSALTLFKDDTALLNKRDEYEKAKKKYDDEQAKKQAEEERKEAEQRRKEEERQRQLEYQRQHPLTITNKNSQYINYLKSFKIEFTVKNTSTFYVSSAKVRVTLLDSNNTAITSKYIIVSDIPAGQIKEESTYVDSQIFYPYYRLDFYDIRF